MNVQVSTPPLPTSEGLDWRDKSLWPDVDKLVTEDDTPVDNPYSEKQMRLLTESLYSSWPGPGPGIPWRVLSNVGLYQRDRDPLVPDVMLGLDLATPDDLMVKGNRAWFMWLVGRPPNATLEIVSNRQGGEDTTKLQDYAAIGVPYYIIHDPLDLLEKGVLRAFALREGKYAPIDPRWLPNLGLGLVLWQGVYEDSEQQWLRWCDEQGNLIPTGAERAAKEKQAREAAELGRATAERDRAAAERDKAAAEQGKAAAEERAARLAARLRELGEDVP